MADYTLRVRRYDPESGEAAYWQDFDVDLEPERSVLDAILRAKWDEDGSLAHPLLVPGRDLRLVRRADQRQVGARLQHQARRGARARARSTATTGSSSSRWATCR